MDLWNPWVQPWKDLGAGAGNLLNKFGSAVLRTNDLVGELGKVLTLDRSGGKFVLVALLDDLPTAQLGATEARSSQVRGVPAIQRSPGREPHRGGEEIARRARREMVHGRCGDSRHPPAHAARARHHERPAAQEGHAGFARSQDHEPHRDLAGYRAGLLPGRRPWQREGGPADPLLLPGRRVTRARARHPPQRQARGPGLRAHDLDRRQDGRRRRHADRRCRLHRRHQRRGRPP